MRAPSRSVGGCAAPRAERRPPTPWPTAGRARARPTRRYRPESGRFSGIGDALLRRTRGRLAGRIDRSPRRAACSTSAPATERCSTRSPGRGREALGLERESQRDRTCEADDHGDLDGELGGDRLLALARAPARARRPSVDHAARHCSPGRRHLLVAVPNAGEPAGAACSATAGSTSTCLATSSTCPAAALTERLRGARARGRRG